MATRSLHDDRTAPPPSRWAPLALVVVNVIPLVGVLAFGWRLYDLMLLYWLENGVIGAFTLLKILTAAPERGSRGAAAGGGVLGRLAVAAFFTVHYGIFWSVHGAFVMTLFGGAFPIGPVAGPALHTFGGLVPLGLGPDAGTAVGAAAGTFGWAVASLVLSHGISYATNFLGRGEDRALTPQELMAQPYGRVVVLHVTIIGGGFLVMLLGAPAAALLLLVALKTGVDLAAHLRERRASAPA